MQCLRDWGSRPFPCRSIDFEWEPKRSLVDSARWQCNPIDVVLAPTGPSPAHTSFLKALNDRTLPRRGSHPEPPFNTVYRWYRSSASGNCWAIYRVGAALSCGLTAETSILRVPFTCQLRRLFLYWLNPRVGFKPALLPQTKLPVRGKWVSDHSSRKRQT